MKSYAREFGTAILLLGVVEAYFWSQGTSLTFEGTVPKVALISLYALIACASQYAISSRGRYPLPEVLKMNLLVAVIVSVGVTFLGFFIHHGLVKDAPANIRSMTAALAKFFLTVGLATAGLRMVVAVVVRFRASSAT